MITNRDIEVINFIEKFKCAKTSTIAKLFYPSLLVAQKRLKKLYEYKELQRYRHNIANEYVYYIKRPKQMKHRLLLTDFYAELSQIVEIKAFENEVILGNIRPDGLVGYVVNNKKYIACVEVQISNQKLNIDKYKKFYNTEEYKKYFPTIPLIVAVTNKRIEEVNEFKIIQVREDLKEIERVVL
ncbi:hypothetical protein [Anaeromicrobium sediminis]|uniref:DUF4143 domain-containing protein n=1 Tax=Anaeromicrobium sediminis TaxID=1478221 RepID=A0A267MN09_9FIRM|nr:hypothetical protein [Anaeromicrobium sediminis]PAB60984.1 hypothetical protein CCE28_00700 [Anaeromicrobium sediminis]